MGEPYAHHSRAKSPNAWGLYSVHGNVWEWVRDWYSDDYHDRSSEIDPPGPKNGFTRVIHGGGFSDVARGLRSACRFRHRPEARGYSIGARLVRTR